MGKIKEFYNQQFEEFNMNDDYDDYDYFERKNEQAKSILEFIFNTEEDEWEAAENYKMEQQYAKIISDIYNNKKCN